jgi:hypothetical protein
MKSVDTVAAVRAEIAALKAAKTGKRRRENEEKITLSGQVSPELAPLVRETLKGQDRGAQTILVNQALAAYYNVDITQ